MAKQLHDNSQLHSSTLEIDIYEKFNIYFFTLHFYAHDTNIV